MPKTMQAMVMHAICDVREEARPIPSPGPRDVLVRLHRVGVCGSDVHYFTHGRIGEFVVRAPIILGHESAGLVEAVGPEVERFTPGQRVTVEPGRTCRRCFFCKRGRYNLCPDVVFLATPPVDGAFCEYLAWPEDFVFPLPDHVSLDAGAMMEPFSVGLWAVHRGEVQVGDCVAAFGAGPIGCLTLAAAKAAGAATCIAVDLSDYRLDFARRYGATHTVNAGAEDPLARILRIAAEDGRLPAAAAGVDVAFETAGVAAATRNTLAAPHAGGVAVLVGLPPEAMVELDLVSAAKKELDIRGEFRYANRYPSAVAMVASGAVDPVAMVTHRFPLSQVADALRFADAHKHDAMKVMIDMPA